MTSREYLKSLTVVHGTLFSLQVLFAGVMFYLRRSGKFATSRLTNLTTKGPANMNEIYFYIILALVCAGIVFSYYLFQSRVRQAKEQKTLFSILNDYRSALVLRDSCLDWLGVFSIIAYTMTGNERCLSLAGLIMLIFLVWWPGRTKVIDDLGLEGEYKWKLEQPDSILW